MSTMKRKKFGGQSHRGRGGTSPRPSKPRRRNSILKTPTTGARENAPTSALRGRGGRGGRRKSSDSRRVSFGADVEVRTYDKVSGSLSSKKEINQTKKSKRTLAVVVPALENLLETETPTWGADNFRPKAVRVEQAVPAVVPPRARLPGSTPKASLNSIFPIDDLNQSSMDSDVSLLNTMDLTAIAKSVEAELSRGSDRSSSLEAAQQEQLQRQVRGFTNLVSEMEAAAAQRTTHFPMEMELTNDFDLSKNGSYLHDNMELTGDYSADLKVPPATKTVNFEEVKTSNIGDNVLTGSAPQQQPTVAIADIQGQSGMTGNHLVPAEKTADFGDEMEITNDFGRGVEATTNFGDEMEITGDWLNGQTADFSERAAVPKTTNFQDKMEMTGELPVDSDIEIERGVKTTNFGDAMEITADHTAEFPAAKTVNFQDEEMEMTGNYQQTAADMKTTNFGDAMEITEEQEAPKTVNFQTSMEMTANYQPLKTTNFGDAMEITGDQEANYQPMKTTNFGDAMEITGDQEAPKTVNFQDSMEMTANYQPLKTTNFGDAMEITGDQEAPKTVNFQDSMEMTANHQPLKTTNFGDAMEITGDQQQFAPKTVNFQDDEMDMTGDSPRALTPKNMRDESELSVFQPAPKIARYAGEPIRRPQGADLKEQRQRAAPTTSSASTTGDEMEMTGDFSVARESAGRRRSSEDRRRSSIARSSLGRMSVEQRGSMSLTPRPSRSPSAFNRYGTPGVRESLNRSSLQLSPVEETAEFELMEDEEEEDMEDEEEEVEMLEEEAPAEMERSSSLPTSRVSLPLPPPDRRYSSRRIIKNFGRPSEVAPPEQVQQLQAAQVVPVPQSKLRVFAPQIVEERTSSAYDSSSRLSMQRQSMLSERQSLAPGELSVPDLFFLAGVRFVASQPARSAPVASNRSRFDLSAELTAGMAECEALRAQIAQFEEKIVRSETMLPASSNFVFSEVQTSNKFRLEALQQGMANLHQASVMIAQQGMAKLELHHAQQRMSLVALERADVANTLETVHQKMDGLQEKRQVLQEERQRLMLRDLEAKETRANQQAEASTMHRQWEETVNVLQQTTRWQVATCTEQLTVLEYQGAVTLNISAGNVSCSVSADAVPFVAVLLQHCSVLGDHQTAESEDDSVVNIISSIQNKLLRVEAMMKEFRVISRNVNIVQNVDEACVDVYFSVLQEAGTAMFILKFAAENLARYPHQALVPSIVRIAGELDMQHVHRAIDNDKCIGYGSLKKLCLGLAQTYMCY